MTELRTDDANAMRPILVAATCVLLTLCCACRSGQAQERHTQHTLRLEAGAIPPAAQIGEFAWLQGYWVGEGLGGTCEEMWSGPLGGAMLGTFRLLNDGRLAFTEFFVLAETDGQVSLKLKHFDPAMKGWEAQDKFEEFRLIKVKGKTAWFHGLTYQLDENGTLHVYVAMKRNDGTLGEAEFTLHRAPSQ